MAGELATVRGETLEKVLIQGDLSDMSGDQRVEYYRRVCESLGLNPLTKPFEYLELDKKLVLYARKDCTEQLRDKRGVSLKLGERRNEGGVYTVVAYATTPDGRFDEATGVVPTEEEGGEWKTASSGKRYFAGNGQFSPVRGVELANAIMKAETKAKRRVTLSICGLGWMDESEVGSIANARVVTTEEAHTSQPASQPAGGPKQLPPKQPTPEPTAAEIDAARKALSEAASIDALKAVWEALSGKLQKATVATMNDRRQHLMKQPAPAEESSARVTKETLSLCAQAAVAADFDYLEPAVAHHAKALGIPADTEPEALSEAHAKVLHDLLRKQAGKGQPVGAA